MSLCKCPICGKEKRNLTKHAKMSHDIEKQDLLNMYPGIKLISDETHDLISDSLRENWKDPIYREKCSSFTRENGNLGGGFIKGHKRSEKAKENYRKAANTEKGKKTRSDNLHSVLTELWSDPEYAQLMREKGREQALEQLNDETRGHKRYKYNNISYRSTWEVECAKVLDKLNIKFEYESKRFNYLDENKINRIYIPDFYIVDYDFYIEVKPDVFKTERTDIKLNAVKEFGKDIYYLSTNDSNEIENFIKPLCQTKTP